MKLLIKKIYSHEVYQDIKFYIQSKRLYKTGKFHGDHSLAIKRRRRKMLIKFNIDSQ